MILSHHHRHPVVKLACRHLFLQRDALKDWERVLGTAKSMFGGLDILINNAGNSYLDKPALRVTDAEFDRLLEVNVKSIYLSVKIAF